MKAGRRAFALAGGLLALIGAATARADAPPSCVATFDPERAASHRPQSASALVIPVEDRGGVSVLEILGDYDHLLTSGEPNVAARMDVAQAFYEGHDDDYDFRVVVTDFEFETGTATALAWPVRNDVQGINLPIHDGSAIFDGRVFRGQFDPQQLLEQVPQWRWAA